MFFVLIHDFLQRWLACVINAVEIYLVGVQVMALVDVLTVYYIPCAGSHELWSTV
jgi:hypothetical protein